MSVVSSLVLGVFIRIEARPSDRLWSPDARGCNSREARHQRTEGESCRTSPDRLALRQTADLKGTASTKTHPRVLPGPRCPQAACRASAQFRAGPPAVLPAQYALRTPLSVVLQSKKWLRRGR